MNAAGPSKRSRSSGDAIIAAALAVSAVQACSSNEAPAQREQREMQPVVRAVFGDNRLWLLHPDGFLASLRPEQARPEPAPADGRVLEICNAGNKPTAVVDGRKDQWKVQQHSDAGWAVRTSLPSEGDSLVALGCKADGDGISLVTSRRLLEVEGTTYRSVRLREELAPPLVSGTALSAGDAVWVGFNRGEWGGGLKRIARDGKVATI